MIPTVCVTQSVVRYRGKGGVVGAWTSEWSREKEAGRAAGESQPQRPGHPFAVSFPGSGGVERIRLIRRQRSSWTPGTPAVLEPVIRSAATRARPAPSRQPTPPLDVPGGRQTASAYFCTPGA